MAKQVLTGVRIFSGGADLTTRSNKVEVVTDVDDKDVTAFAVDGAAWKEVLGGLFSTGATASGQWEAGDTSMVDDDMWAQLGGLGGFTVLPNGANTTPATGDLAEFTNALRGSYKVGGQIGDAAPWEAKLMGAWPYVRGLLANPPGTARTVTGNGADVVSTATSATTRLYGVLHVLSVSGTASPTLTVKIQSDDNSGFTTPTDRLTFTAATARGAEIKREAAVGANADTHYRATWTISGTNPSFLFVAAFGIAA